MNEEIKEILSALCPIYDNGMCGHSIIECEKPCIHIDEAERIENKFNEIRKQTAEKFLNMIYWKAVKHIKGRNKDECFIEISFEKLDEIAKQYGVEIKE